MAAKKCSVFVQAFVAEPGSTSGYGVFEAEIPCDEIRWEADRPQPNFRPRLSDFYQVHVGLCRGDQYRYDCPKITADFDVRGPGRTYRRRKR
jgi:hypothetical protein